MIVQGFRFCIEVVGFHLWPVPLFLKVCIVFLNIFPSSRFVHEFRGGFERVGIVLQ
jgi:hypothetical protein